MHLQEILVQGNETCEEEVNEFLLKYYSSDLELNDDLN